MSNTDTTQLQKEIALRGRIIEALVNSNEELRHKYANAASFIRSKADTYSLAEKEMLQNMLGNTAYDSGKGITGDSYSITEKSKGITEYNYSTSENSNGITESNYSDAENNNGTTEFSYSTSENSSAITNERYSIAEKGKGITTPVSSIPEKLGKENVSIVSLHEHIREHGKHRGKHSASWATTELLIHIYNGGHCGYPTLKKVTRLSTGGLGKMLMRLTKRGLIKRIGLQKLELTPSALHILGKAYNAAAK